MSLEVCEQQRHRPACASSKSDQRLCYSFFEKWHILWFLSRFVRKPKDRFCRDEAQYYFPARRSSLFEVTKPYIHGLCSSHSIRLNLFSDTLDVRILAGTLISILSQTPVICIFSNSVRSVTFRLINFNKLSVKVLITKPQQTPLVCESVKIINSTLYNFTTFLLFSHEN